MHAENWSSWLPLILAWFVYFLLHSLLASLMCKRWVASRWPGFMPAYRLTFNVLAVIFLMPIAWLLLAQSWPMVWQWQGGTRWLAHSVSVLAVLGFIWSLKYYDMQEFLGLKQWRGHVSVPEDQEHFQLSPLHRYVRHPWYFFGMLLLWARDMNAAQLLSSVLVSIYFTLGARLEERKLLVYHGERYRRYRAKVPALFPLPWKYLSKAESQELQKGPQ